jgi:glycosyltransferase involved in cell wall biosynthesis
VTVTRPPQRRLAVTMLVGTLGRGGAEIFAVELAQRLDRARFDVALCVTRRAFVPDIREAVEQADLPVVYLDRTSSRDVRPWGRLVRHLRAQPADILHAHTFSVNVWASVIGRVARTPVIIATEHTWSYEGQPMRVFLDRHLVARNAAFVAVSERDRARMIAIERIPAEVTRVIPTAYRGNSVTSAPPLRSLIGAEQAGPIIGVVATLRPQKALGVLMRAFQLVRRQLPAAHLVVIGDGPERHSLESLAASLGLERDVTFLGDRPDAVGLLAEFDVFALSSDFEGTPLALIEAMWASKAVVVTRVGGMPEMIVDGESGLLVAPGSPEALAEAIERLLGDAALRARLGAKAGERAHALYSFERSVEAWEHLYCELYERARPRG